MHVLVALILAVAASEAGAPKAEAAPKSADVGPMRTATLIDHTPLEKSARGLSVVIKARIDNPSTLFAPQVFARPAGSKRYQGYTMQELRKGKTFQARLPASLLNDGAVEYFIEARTDDNGGVSRAGTPQQPFTTLAFDPPPVPVPTTFRTDLEGADVKVDGDVLGKTPLTVTLAPGPHTITILAPDGRSTEQQIDVKSGQKKLNLLIPLPSGEGGGLQVTSEPPGAKVFVDGVAVGSTPYLGPLEPGEHVVRVEADGRLHQERQVVARQGRDASLSFSLPLLPKDPALNIESDPAGALVTIDGKDRGRTPWVGPLAAGQHQVVLKLEGRRSVATDFQMPKDRDMSLRLELPAGSSSSAPKLTISSNPAGATVVLDGHEVGFTPWSEDVKPGDRKVKVSLAGYKPDERKLTVAAGRDADVAFNLTREPGPGKLRLETEPPEAIVSVDGTQVGTTPFSGDVAPGEHNLEVALEGFRGVAQPFTLEAGQQLALKLALQPAGAERVPPLIAVASDPQGAQLLVDGKPSGTTPVKVRSTPGAHEIKLVLDGYVTRTGKINLPDSRDFELRMAISLKPLRGTAVVQSAPDPVEVARAQLKRASACYRQGDFKCALEGYQQAYEYKPVPELLYNIAQTRRRKADYREAADAYRSFIKEATNPKMKAEAEKYLAVCEMQLDPDKARTSLALASGETAAARAARGPMPTISGPAGEPTPAASATAPGAAPVEAGQKPPAEGTAKAPEALAAKAPEGAGKAASNLFNVEEDQDPPLISHAPVAKAIRGQPLRLMARIVDERSDVANAQACWKNLFKPDYQCAQLIKVGEDQFGIEVPAKAITDGFAYYLEAYDSSENGPARAGAPELPNAVAIEEAAPPKPVAVVEAPKAEEKPVEARPAAPPEALGAAGPGKPGAPEGPKSHLLSYIFIGGAVATIAAGVGLNYHASTQLDSLTQGTHTRAEIDSITSQANTEKVVGYALFGVSGALILGAIAFWNSSF